MKNKVRIAPKATKGKGNRWKKGESSSCNATTTKFRQKVNLLSSTLTSNKSSDDFDTLKLDQLNIVSKSSDDAETELKSSKMDIDLESVGSCNTFASIYTNCTNESFSKLMEDWNPSSLLHREMVAVLASVTETIKEKGGNESETEYFAILITLLESTEKEETLAAIAYLLSMVIRKLPEAVKKVKFPESSQLFASAIVKHQDVANNYLVVSLIRCLSELIKAQDANVLKSTSTRKVFEIILTLTLNPKPKIRKSAHRSIVSILKASTILWKSNAIEHHVLAPVAAKFCVDKILSASKDNINDALHMINLIKDIITVLPDVTLKECCSTITRAMYLADPLLINGGLQVLLTLFSSSSPLRDLTAKLNLKLLKALEDLKPSSTDTQTLSLWISTMKEGYISFYALDRKKCLLMLSTLFNLLITCCESDSKVIHSTVSTSLQQVIKNIFAPSVNELDRTILVDITEVFKKSLSFKYQNAWGHICAMIGTFMEHVGQQAPELVSPFIKILIDLREGFNTKFVAQIDNAVSKAIKTLGPKIIIKAVPIEMDLTAGNSEFAHSWLIPLLRDNIEKTELATFKSFFLPLANRVEDRIKILEKEGVVIQTKIYSTLYNQLWSLVPSFCRHPTDLKTAFTSDFARLLGKMIQEKQDIRNHCLAALRNVIKTCQKPEEIAVLKPFAKNYLPIFFNIYINPETYATDAKDVAPVYETLRVYLTITDETVIRTNLQKVLERLAAFDGDVKLRYYLLDLLSLFIPYLKSADEITEIFQKVVSQAINDLEDNTRRKKGYRLVQEICKNEHCQEFIQSFNGDVIEILMKLVSSSPGQAKYLPLVSVEILLSKQIITLQENHTRGILLGIIECVESGRIKCKKAAFDLLSKLSSYTDNMLRILIELVPLSKPDLKPAEILVLGRALLEAENNTLEEKKGKLFGFLDLLKSDKRPIIRSIFQILNIWLKRMEREELLHTVYNIVMSLATINEEHRKAFRKEVKAILTRLVRKCGYEIISKFCPEYYAKVLKNIKKAEVRKARLKDAEDNEEDADSDTITTTHKSTKTFDDILYNDSDDDDNDDESDNMTYAPSRKSVKSSRSNKSRSEAFIEEEGDEEEILDLMAPDINRKIHSTNPMEANKPVKKKDDFPMTEDGKIIIDMKEDRNAKRKRNDEDDDEAEADQEDDAKTRSGISGVSKISKASTNRANYKPGGKGIHRPIKKRKSGIKGAKLGEEYAARKAGGDIKKKTGPDPYAYIPLNGALLNRRKKNKYKGYFNKLANKKGKSENVNN